MHRRLTHRIRHLSATAIVGAAALVTAGSASASAATLPPNPCVQYLRCVLDRTVGQPVTPGLPAARMPAARSHRV